MQVKELTKQQKEISSKLEKLIKNANFIVMCRNNNDLSKIVWDQISALYFIEQKINNDKKTTVSSKFISSIELADKLNVLLNTKGEIDKTKQFSKIEEIQDSFNYLSVFLVNNYKKSLDDILDSKTSTDSENFSEKKCADEKNENVKKESATAEKIDNNFSSNNESEGFFNRTNSFGGNNPFSGQNINKETFKENYLYTIATQRLNSEIMNGTFYKFKTKPKSILVAKKILGFLFAVVAFISVMVLILDWLTLGLLYNGLNSTQEQPYEISSGSLLYQTLLSIFYIVAFVYTSISMFKKETNENKKYEFQKVITIIFAIIFLLQILSLVQAVRFRFPIIDSLETSNLGNPLWKINSFKASTYVSIIQICLYVFVIIAVGYAVSQSPKPDVDKINLKIKQYMDEMRNQI